MLARSVSSKIIKSNVMKRSFVSKTNVARGGAGEGEHHDHPLWENLPFKKSTGLVLVGGGVFTGVGLIVFAWKFQNWKQGF